jgi:hypothetical protein
MDIPDDLAQHLGSHMTVDDAWQLCQTSHQHKKQCSLFLRYAFENEHGVMPPSFEPKAIYEEHRYIRFLEHQEIHGLQESVAEEFMAAGLDGQGPEEVQEYFFQHIADRLPSRRLVSALLVFILLFSMTMQQRPSADRTCSVGQSKDAIGRCKPEHWEGTSKQFKRAQEEARDITRKEMGRRAWGGEP